MKRVLKTDIVPELQAKVKATADKLAKSQEDSMVIEGADNKTLVKANSTLAAKMRKDGMFLFPYATNGADYLICITTAR